MNLIRDPLTIALNDLISACLEAAELYDTAAAGAERDDVAIGFANLARDRRRPAEQLGEEVRRAGDLPPADPNDEKVLFEKGWTKLRALVAPDTDAQLLANCAAKEAKVAEAAEAVLEANPGDEARRLAQHLIDDARDRA